MPTQYNVRTQTGHLVSGFNFGIPTFTKNHVHALVLGVIDAQNLATWLCHQSDFVDEHISCSVVPSPQTLQELSLGDKFKYVGGSDTFMVCDLEDERVIVNMKTFQVVTKKYFSNFSFVFVFEDK